MKYAVDQRLIQPGGPHWHVCVRYRSGGFKMNYFERLQDAYAWLFGLGAFEPKPARMFDIPAISGAKEENEGFAR